MSHLMSNELGQAVINYLGTQPYAQVSKMIAGLQQMGEVDDKELGEFLASKKDVDPKPPVLPPVVDPAGGDGSDPVDPDAD